MLRLSAPVLRLQVRTRCDAPNFHNDFVSGVGINALTLLAPLRDYGHAKGFHLLYEEAKGAPDAVEATEAKRARKANEAKKAKEVVEAKEAGQPKQAKEVVEAKEAEQPKQPKQEGAVAEGEGAGKLKGAETTAGEEVMAGGSASEGMMTAATAAPTPPLLPPLPTPVKTVAARWCPPAAGDGLRPQPLSVSRARRTAKSTGTPQRLAPADANAGERLRPEAIDAAGFGHEHYARRGATRRYDYTLGKAIVFGSGFRHSTEPGRAAAGTSPHVYLCFTFGSDMPEHWPLIAQTVDGDQSRVIAPPGGDGAVALSRLGRRLRDEHEASDTAEGGVAKASRQSSLNESAIIDGQ